MNALRLQNLGHWQYESTVLNGTINDETPMVNVYAYKTGEIDDFGVLMRLNQFSSMMYYIFNVEMIQFMDMSFTDLRFSQLNPLQNRNCTFISMV